MENKIALISLKIERERQLKLIRNLEQVMREFYKIELQSKSQTKIIVQNAEEQLLDEVTKQLDILERIDAIIETLVTNDYTKEGMA